MWLSHETDRPLSAAISHYQYSILMILIWITDSARKGLKLKFQKLGLDFDFLLYHSLVTEGVVRGLLQQDYHHLQCPATDS